MMSLPVGEHQPSQSQSVLYLSYFADEQNIYDSKIGSGEPEQNLVHAHYLPKPVLSN